MCAVQLASRPALVWGYKEKKSTLWYSKKKGHGEGNASAKMYWKNTFSPYTYKYISVVQIASVEASHLDESDHTQDKF